MLRTLMTAAFFSMIICVQNLNVEAASVDDELSIMAAEQKRENSADVTVNDDVESFDDKSSGEQKKNPSDNQGNNQNDNPINTPPANDQKERIEAPTNTDNKVPASTNSTNEKIPELKDLQDSAGMPSPITTYSNFVEAAKKIGYIPLYVTKKSGYTLSNIATINNNIAELRYSRSWEPTVTLTIRTYKRAPGEQVKDISGIYGVKWKVDLSGGMTIYIARVNNTTSVAAWSVGQYTFAAMTENLSFAAFHALIVDDLSDICNHYFIDIN